MKRVFKAFKYLLLILVLLIGLFCALNYRADVPVAELKAKYANPESKFMDLYGMSVHYRDEGSRDDKLPVVLLHGTSASLLTWNGWTETLKAEHRVIRLDLPGYGLTGPNPANDYSMEFYTRFLHDFLRALGVEQSVMVGNSFGGRIAWEYALAYPTEVKKLILIDASGYPTPQGRPLAMRIATTPILKNILLYITPRQLVEKSLREVYVDKSKVTSQLVDEYYDMACREGNRAAFVARANITYKDDYVKINQIRIPTLVLWGARDAWLSVENAYKFQKDLPNNSLIVYENLGHIPQEENPSQTVKDALKFLD